MATFRCVIFKAKLLHASNLRTSSSPSHSSHPPNPHHHAYHLKLALHTVFTTISLPHITIPILQSSYLPNLIPSLLPSLYPYPTYPPPLASLITKPASLTSSAPHFLPNMGPQALPIWFVAPTNLDHFSIATSTDPYERK